ncbi:MAG: Trk system potassium transporter TrkA [Gammaproteobacteria bacterium]|nr:MAG: Trk system potassium transporter TrkA [Gammaproteobacteria bacterium]
MKIIILGAGQVGVFLAHKLSEEGHDITIVDTLDEQLQDVVAHYDVRTVIGPASYPQTLSSAGADQADMLIAVTKSDETNMLACQVASTLYKVPRKIARIRSKEYLTRADLFGIDAIPVDIAISPEQLVIDSLSQLIQYPGAFHVYDFADGQIGLVGVRTTRLGPLVNHKIKDLKKHLPGVQVRIVGVYRNNSPMMPAGNLIIEEDDEVFFIAKKRDIRVIIREFRGSDIHPRRIMIAGGGNIGSGLAQALESQYQVKVIEARRHRAEQISEFLDNTHVLLGDSTSEELLLEENIEHIDIFCALTNADDTNIISSLLAKRMGAKKVFCIINRISFVNLIEGGKIDIAISPQFETIGSILAHIRRGDVTQVHAVRHGSAEALETVVHGNLSTSKVIGRSISDIIFPEGAVIGAILRGDEILIAHHDTVIEENDHVISFVYDLSLIKKVENLFQAIS